MYDDHKKTPVITGDIIGSQDIAARDRPLMVRALGGISDALLDCGTRVQSVDLFRGDSFQILLEDPAKITDAAFFTRIWFRKVALAEGGILDARLGLGLGPVEYATESLSLSDGTAFRHAAETLEEAYSDKLSQVHFRSQDPDLDNHLNAMFIAIEPLMSTLTSTQSQSLWWSLQGHTHKAIASRLEVTQSTVTRSLQGAHDKHIKYVMKYMQRLVAGYLGK